MDERAGHAHARAAGARSVLVAVVLSGLGPGAGHLYVGEARRGTILVALWLASSAAWTTRVAGSWSAARLWALPMILLLLAILVDSGRRARDAPRPFVRGPLQRWWLYAIVIAVTGFIAPLALTSLLEAQVGVVQVMDDSMQPRLGVLDRVVHDRRPGDLATGDVVVMRWPDGERLRRVVGLPGERVEIRAGRVFVDGRPWLADPARLTGRSRLAIRETRVAPGEILLLSDQRHPGEAATWRLPRSEVVGRATWILLPAGFDPLRVGAPVR